MSRQAKGGDLPLAYTQIQIGLSTADTRPIGAYEAAGRFSEKLLETRSNGNSNIIITGRYHILKSIGEESYTVINIISVNIDTGIINLSFVGDEVSYPTREAAQAVIDILES